MQDFLPVTKKEMKQRGWEQVDFAYITGDAYVDHPSFGTAIISRLLESRGYKLEKEGEYSGIWRASTGISGVCGKYGLYGKSLYSL